MRDFRGNVPFDSKSDPFDPKSPSISNSPSPQVNRLSALKKAAAVTAPHDPRQPASSEHDDVIYPSVVPFIIVHLVCFAAIWTGVTWGAVATGIGLYWLRIFAIGAGYHRYFSHRAYGTSRVFQFVLAFLAQSTAQKSILWWASKHRHHHLHSDTEQDVHSPRQRGFFYAHVGWIFTVRHDKTDLSKIADFARYPELMLLHKYELAPAIMMGTLVFLLGGWSCLVVGFFWSTVALYHATFCINSLAHVIGKKRYVTGDDSRNNWLLAFFTMGEGWHNNHHAYQASARQGFRWWEFDPTYYLLRALSWVGVVWDLKSPPKAVLRNEQRLGSKVIERAAQQLAISFDPERIAAALESALAGTPSLAELQEKLREARHMAADALANFSFPAIPTREEIRARAAAIFAQTPSLDDIVERANRMILEKVYARMNWPVAREA
jgi:stearoyl-CoA desaturase (delta-9 desaturase)